MHRISALVFALCLLATSAHGAGPDGVVESDGVSHLPHWDLRPLCPVDGEPFTVRVLARKDDLTAVRIAYDAGGAGLVGASVVEDRGTHDVWAAQIPASSSTGTVTYLVELEDGGTVRHLGPDGVFTSPPANSFTVDFATLSHARYGATITTTGAVFRVWAPTRTVVYVRGDFNGWGLGNPMTKVGEDFIGHVTGASPRQQYKYFFNNSVWNSDARGRGLNPSDNLNTFVEDTLGYAWSEPWFTPPDPGMMAIYQLHVGTFAGLNDPAGSAPFPSRYVDVAARVDHLVELGVNAVLLNPITEFAGDVSAGYNPISQYAPEWKFGTPDQLKAMIDAFHAQGIAVLIDIVWNHFSVNDNFMWNYDGSQIYFDDPPVDTPWGAQADFDADAVRQYFLDSAMVWLEEYRVDGFRMDATSFMDQGAHSASGFSLMQELNDLMDRRYPDRVCIAEELPDDSWITRPTSSGGAGFDSQYYDRFTDDLRQEVEDASFGDPEMWKLQALVNGGGLYLEGVAVTNYLELHDEAWPQNGGQRMVVTIDPTAPHDDEFAQGRTTLAQGFVFTAPGIPAMTQGSEWLESIGWGPDFQYRIDWSKKTTYGPVFDYYQALMGLRTQNPALHADAFRNVHHVDEAGNVLGYVRSDLAGNSLVVLANFSNNDYTDYRVGLPEAGTWEEILNSQDPAFGGSGPVNPGFRASEPTGWDGYGQSLELSVPGMGLVVLRWKGQGTATPDDPTLARDSDLEWIAPNPSPGQARVRFRVGRTGDVRLELIDVRGRRIRELHRGVVEAGAHELVVDGRDLPNGVYYLRLQTQGTQQTQRVLFLR